MIQQIHIATPDGYSAVEVRVREGRWVLTAASPGGGKAAEILKGGVEDPEATLEAAGFTILSEKDVEALDKAKGEKAEALRAEQAAKAAEEASARAAVKAKEDAEIAAWLDSVKAPAAAAKRFGL